jgi:F1-F0 ATPase (N-ATPase) AtpR subunit
MTLSAITIFGGIGVALGLAHFYGLRRDVGMYLVGGMRGRVVAAHATRLLATAAALVFIARSGAVPLLAALAGFLAARSMAVAKARRPA